MVVAFLSVLLSVHMLFAVPRMELALTVPVETDLGVAGIRDSQEVWLEMLKGAKTSIAIEQFYITDQSGEPLRSVLDAIRERAEDGVAVRLIADSKFFKTYPQWVTEVGQYANAEAKIIDFSPGIQHAKFFVVDHNDAFIGSQNFDWRALKHIHELGIRTEDAGIAAKLEKIFELDWKKAKSLKKTGNHEFKAPKDVATDPALAFVASPAKANPKGITSTIDALSQIFKAAQSSIVIQVMDYSVQNGSEKSTWNVLDQAIRTSAGRGVKVQLLVDDKTRKNVTALAGMKNVTVRTAKIPECSCGHIDYARLIHSKYLIADGKTAWIGTENWSRGYFFESRNVGVIVTDTTVVSQVSQIFEKIWRSPYVNPVSSSG